MGTAVIVGGGAAGFFAAITCAEASPGHEVIILEATGQTLAKVRISGGGRCNVTHDCLIPKKLVTHYPRGSQELLGPFSRFGPEQVIEWFSYRGVTLKTEADGRMFPETDQSQTIIDCLTESAHDAGVKIQLHQPVRAVRRNDSHGWRIEVKNDMIAATTVLLATGSHKSGHKICEHLGHTVVAPVPSLFTCTCQEMWIRTLAGVAVESVTVTLLDTEEKIITHGPLLCTHWGISGPAVLRASAWGARALAAANYKTRITIDWLNGENAQEWCDNMRASSGGKLIKNTTPSVIPRRLWEALVQQAGIAETGTWSQLARDQVASLARQLNECPLTMTGKSTFKDEFVTAGGLARDEINWRTMESRQHAGLFLAGECLDVDAITGGFNFQNAWTTGWLAGNAMAACLAAANG